MEVQLLVLLGMLLMVLVSFLLKDFSLYPQLVNQIDTFTKIQAKVKLMIVSCDKQQGSVANAINLH
jgi:hypothetical protein